MVDPVDPLSLAAARSPHWHWFWLAVIVLGGAGLRFLSLGRPCLWGDEALVYWRTCGSYANLLNCLRDDGFVPLHYEAAWLLAQRFKPTPVMLRLLPAVCGSLCVLTTYFLARQLVGKKASLVAALLAATSAFGCFYSRDAKMYAELWLFSTLNLACLLWWLRTHRLTAWLGWIAAGCLAAGVHADGLIFPALAPLLLLVARRCRWSDALWLTIGGLVIALGPAGYYGVFNEWNQRVDQNGWNASGLQWVDWENAGRTGPAMARSMFSSILMGWTYPIPTVEPLVAHRTMATLNASWVVLVSVLAIALLPWPRRWRCIDERAPEKPWRMVLLLGLVVVPAGYVFYCHSMPEFAGPGEWLSWILDALPAFASALLARPAGWLILLVLLVAAASAGFSVRRMRPFTAGALQYAIVGSVLIGLCAALHVALVPMAENASLSNRAWHSLWVPRYLGFLWPILLIAMAAVLLRLPGRWVRRSAIVLFCGVNLLMVARRIFGNTEPPVDRMSADVFASQPAQATVRTYTAGGRGGPVPGDGDLISNSGRYYLQQLSWTQPMSPAGFHRILYDYNLRGGMIPSTIFEEVKLTPGLRRVITWSSVQPGQSPSAIAPLVMPGWSLVHDDAWAVTSYWDFKPMLCYVRREYARSAR